MRIEKRSGHSVGDAPAPLSPAQPPRRYGLEPPKVTFVQSQMNSHQNRSGLIVIIDNGPQMASHWSVIRNGLAQLMLVLPRDTLIGGIMQLYC